MKANQAEQAELVPAVREDAVPQSPLCLAIAKGADIATIERLVALQERMDAEKARREYFAAFAAMQAAMPQILRVDRVAFGTTKYNFASLGRIAEAAREALQAHGFSYRFEIADSGAALSVACIVTHSGGHSERTAMTAPADGSGSKNPIQARGSSVTYLQRYTLLAALGIVTAQEDTDGHAKDPAVSPEQLARLENAIMDCPAGTEAGMLKWAGVGTLADFPARLFGEAWKILEKKVAGK